MQSKIHDACIYDGDLFVTQEHEQEQEDLRVLGHKYEDMRTSSLAPAYQHHPPPISPCNGMTRGSSEKYRHKEQRLVTDIADRGVTTSHHQARVIWTKISYGPTYPGC